MGFPKYAKARVTNATINQAVWEDIRAKACLPSPTFEIRKASQVVLQQYDPAQYLLSHCTIIASVDTETPVGLPTGKQMFDGVQIDRKFPDFYITTGTTKYINNNNDAWERKLLLSSFRTFIGGENYVEHIQIPELSKGKIIDAAARDIGDSVYVDILIATDRKHRELIAAILDGTLSTLSMGCFLPETPVTLGDGRRIPIEEVVPGDMVLTHKGRSREVLNKQIHIGMFGMRRIEVVGVPDQISVTNNHPFYVIRSARVCACGCGQILEVKDRDPVRRILKRFKQGHSLRVLNPNGTYSIEEAQLRKRQLKDISSFRVEKVRSDELQVGDYVVFPKLETEIIEDPGTDRARLLGYFLAEGSFVKRKGVYTEVVFSFSTDAKSTFVSEVVQLLKDSFTDCKPYTSERPITHNIEVHVSGKSIASWFKKHGGEYSHRKHLSLEAMHWSSESHRQLLGAWLNGDGGAQVNGSLVGTTTSYDLACQLHVLSIQCGLPARIECFFGGKASTISEAVANGEALRHPETGKLAHFNLTFSKSTSSPLVDVCSKAPTKKSESHLRDLDGMVIFPITRIEPFQYEGAVFNIEVDEDHSYQVEGVSVGNCHVSFTVCTKCGNVAEDETQLCRHIKYEKGQWFIDASGKRRKVAELCGHAKVEPGSVKFIEGSWVANPAFVGAVLNKILDPKTALMAETAIKQKIQVAFSRPVEVFDVNSMQKAARLNTPHRSINVKATPGDHLAYLYDGPSIGYLRTPAPFSGSEKAAQALEQRLNEISQEKPLTAQQDFPGESDFTGPTPSTPPEKENPFKKTIDDLYGAIVDEVTKKVKKDLSDSNKDKNESTLDPNRSNESLIKSALKYSKWVDRAKMVAANVKDEKSAKSVLAGLILHDVGGWQAVAQAKRFSGREILVMCRLLERATKKSSLAGDTRIYKTVIAVGGTRSYPNVDDYLTACSAVMGRTPIVSERAQLIEKGELFSLGIQ